MVVEFLCTTRQFWRRSFSVALCRDFTKFIVGTDVPSEAQNAQLLMSLAITHYRVEGCSCRNNKASYATTNYYNTHNNSMHVCYKVTRLKSTVFRG